MTMGLPLSTQKLDTRKLGQNSNIKQKKLLKETLFILEVSVLSYFYKRNYFSTVLYIEKLANENERRGPDHQCGPSILRGPVILGGPKVVSLFFIILRKMSKTQKKNRTSFFFNNICSMPIFEICNYDDLRFVLVGYYIIVLIHSTNMLYH